MLIEAVVLAVLAATRPPIHVAENLAVTEAMKAALHARIESDGIEAAAITIRIEKFEAFMMDSAFQMAYVLGSAKRIPSDRCRGQASAYAFEEGAWHRLPIEGNVSYLFTSGAKSGCSVTGRESYIWIVGSFSDDDVSGIIDSVKQVRLVKDAQGRPVAANPIPPAMGKSTIGMIRRTDSEVVVRFELPTGELKDAFMVVNGRLWFVVDVIDAG